MEDNNIGKILNLLDSITITPENEEIIYEIKRDLAKKDYIAALSKMEKLNKSKSISEKAIQNRKKTDLSAKQPKPNTETKKQENNANKTESIYPEQLRDRQAERIYMGLLLNDPKQIVKYYF